MDLNNLKVYNDTKGHSAGDRALITVSQIMEDIFSKHAKLYRTGGDEFMAIFTKHDKAFVENLVADFQISLKATEYMVACGIAEYTPGDDIEKVIKGEYVEDIIKQKVMKLHNLNQHKFATVMYRK